MSKDVVVLAEFAANHAVRIHRERKLRGPLIESLVPCDVSLSGTMLIIKYWLGESTPEYLLKRIINNRAWALHLFAVIQEVEFGDEVVTSVRVKRVRLTDSAVPCVEVIFKVKNPEEYAWIAAKRPEFFKKAKERLQYQFA